MFSGFKWIIFILIYVDGLCSKKVKWQMRWFKSIAWCIILLKHVGIILAFFLRLAITGACN